MRPLALLVLPWDQGLAQGSAAVNLAKKLPGFRRNWLIVRNKYALIVQPDASNISRLGPSRLRTLAKDLGGIGEAVDLGPPDLGH
jgi:hypothetical protein